MAPNDGLNDEERLILQAVKRFASDEVRPFVRFIDEHGGDREGHEKYLELKEKAGAMGLLALGMPAEYGGAPASIGLLGRICETVGRYAGSFVTLGAPPALTMPFLIARFGTPEQKEAILPSVCAGKIPAISLGSTEPSGGSDISSIATTARRVGDSYVLKGEKTFISGAQWAKYCIVVCKTAPELGHRGVSLLLVDLDAAGVRRVPQKSIGWHSIEMGGLVFEDAKVPVASLLGEENRGFYQLMELFGRMRIGLPCGMLGVAEGALDESIQYVKGRSAFGRPIAKFEAVQFRMVEDATILEAARALTFRVLAMLDGGAEARKEVSMMKLWVPNVAHEVVTHCLQNYGATGYTLDTLNELRLREIMGSHIADGTPDIQKMIIGREILGKEYDPTRP